MLLNVCAAHRPASILIQGWAALDQERCDHQARRFCEDELAEPKMQKPDAFPGAGFPYSVPVADRVRRLRPSHEPSWVSFILALQRSH